MVSIKLLLIVLLLLDLLKYYGTVMQEKENECHWYIPKDEDDEH